MSYIHSFLSSSYSPGGIVQDLVSTCFINPVLEDQALDFFRRFNLDTQSLDPLCISLPQQGLILLTNAIVIVPAALIFPVWIYTHNLLSIFLVAFAALVFLAQMIRIHISIIRQPPYLGHKIAENLILQTSLRLMRSEIPLSGSLREALRVIMGLNRQPSPALTLLSVFDEANMQNVAKKLLEGCPDAVALLEEYDPAIYQYYIAKLIFLYAVGEFCQSDLPKIDNTNFFKQQTEDFILSIRERLLSGIIQESEIRQCLNLFNNHPISLQDFPSFFKEGLGDVVFSEIRIDGNVILFLHWAAAFSITATT